MRGALAALAVVLATQGQASPIAEVICAPTEDMRARLTAEFGNVRRGTGVRNPEEVVELWSRPSGSDWTLVISYASGKSCIVAMGEHWIPAPAQS